MGGAILGVVYTPVGDDVYYAERQKELIKMELKFLTSQSEEGWLLQIVIFIQL